MREPIPKRKNRAFSNPRLREPNRPGRNPRQPGKRSRWKWRLRILLLSLVIAAAAAGFWLPVDSWHPATLLHQKILPTLQMVRQKFERNEKARVPYLALENSTASINRPLSLGIVLNNGLGGETLVLSGLVEGTTLSAGSALTSTRWSLPAHDLEKAFISAPENFEGVMDVTVTLYSSSQDVLDTKQAPFYWSGSGKGDKLPVTSLPAQNPAR